MAFWSSTRDCLSQPSSSDPDQVTIHFVSFKLTCTYFVHCWCINRMLPQLGLTSKITLHWDRKFNLYEDRMINLWKSLAIKSTAVRRLLQRSSTGPDCSDHPTGEGSTDLSNWKTNNRSKKTSYLSYLHPSGRAFLNSLSYIHSLRQRIIWCSITLFICPVLLIQRSYPNLQTKTDTEWHQWF